MSVYEDKFEKYDLLMNTYIDTISKLIDISYTMKILPLKVMFGVNYIKKYINENRFEVLENGINYILSNKEIIINFDINNLDELDEDFNDNISVKTCVNNLKKNNNLQSNISSISDSDDILNLIIDIKNNTKKLHIDDVNIIKKYFELLILILEKIELLFL